jgi:putative ABC transport system permease protein
MNGMKQAAAGATAGKSRHTIRSTLVITEVALAFLLLTGAGLLLRSFARLQTVDTGFDATNVLTASLPIAEKQFPDTAAFTAYFRELTDRVKTLPGVRDVALTSALPLRGWGYGMPFQRADKPVVDHANRAACYFKMVSPSYFRVIGMKLIRGRQLTERDTKGAPPVTVISESMRKKHFGDEDPIGKRILVQEIVFGKPELGPEIPWEVVGIVADEKIGSMDEKETSPGMYVSVDQCTQLYQTLVLKADSDPALLHQALRDTIHRLNANQTVSELKSLEQIKVESMGSNRLRSLLLGAFGSVALLLSAIGIYGVVSYSVAQRTREIGIRSALGAGSGEIMRMVLRSGMFMVAVGLVVGAAGVLGLTRLLSSLLFGVGERDPLTIGGVAVLLTLIAIVACLVPARRAAKISPLVALRYE